MDDDAEEGRGASGPPLPPDDRLWRHPSELGAVGPAAAPVSAVAVLRRTTVWPVAVAAGLLGALLAGGLLAATGTLDSERTATVIEKVAVTPVVSSPMVSGDRGVPMLAQRVSPTIVRVVVHTSSGDATIASGVVFRTDGLVLTSADEVADHRSISVVLHDGTRHEAQVIGIDDPTDVAVLRIDADGLPVAVLGSSEALAPGTPTVAFGCPHGTDDLPRLTTGVISALDQRIDVDGSPLHGLIQTDAQIAAAASGGPLVDASGAGIGITSAGSGEPGFGYATPIDLVARVAHQLVDSGRASHGWIGIEGADLSTAQAEAMGLPGGAMVRDVTGGGPAAAGGLAPGDVIVEVGSQPVVSSSDLVVALRGHAPGDTVTIGYHRDGRPAEAEVVLRERP